MWQPGETVQLIDSRDRGQLVQVYADGRALVRLADGLEIEVDTRDLAPVAHVPAATTAAPPATAAASRPADLPPGIYLVLERPLATRAVLYLANLGDTGIVFGVFRPAPGNTDTVHARRSGLLHGHLAPGKVQLLLTAQGSDWERQFGELVLTWFYFQAEAHLALAPVQVPVRLRGKQLAKPGHPNPATGNPATYLPLTAPASPAASMPDPAETLAQLAAQSDQMHISGPPPSEVDLHIERLTPDHAKLTAGECLQLQLEAFERALSGAVAHHLKEIVFIHGLGKGSLRAEIHKRLRQNRHVRSFVLDDSRKYAYGATRVRL